MRCPSCNAEVGDTSALYCGRCGGPLDGCRSTSPLDEAAGSTDPLGSPSTNTPGNRARPLSWLGAQLRSSGWGEALATASIAFLAALCVGAVLLIAAKLQFPRFGSGFDPLSVLTAMVLLALASLGASVQVGAVEVSVLPQGALVAIGLGLIWSVRQANRRGGSRSSLGSALEGARAGLCFGVLCGAAALVFRFRTPPDPVAVDAWEALQAGTIWGLAFSVLGGLLSRAPLAAYARSSAGALERRSRLVLEGLEAAMVMLGGAVALASAAVLSWAIVALARGSLPPRFGVGEAIAAIVYLAAFAPNIVFSVIALSLGAPLEAGGTITVAGREIGRISEYSLLDWGEADPPLLAFLLLLIPIVSCLLGGTSARRNARDKERPLEVLGLAAIVFGLALFLLCALSEARLGAGLLGRRGLARVAPNPLEAGALACGWAAALGYLGWKLGERRSARAPQPSHQEEP